MTEPQEIILQEVLGHLLVVVGGVLLAIVLVVLGWAISLKRKVAARTRAFVEEISERKRTEEELRLHSAMLNNMEEGVALMRMDNAVIVYVNPKFAELFGYEEKEMLGHPASILNAPTTMSSEEVAAYILGVLNREGIWKGEVFNRKKDGSTFWSYASVITFEHPVHGRVLVTAQYDISERKRAEEALKASEYRFRQLYEKMGSGVAVYKALDDGKDFIFNDMNQAGLRISQITSKEEISGRSVLEVFPGVKELGLFEVFQRVWRTGIPAHHPVSRYKDTRITQWVENEVYKLPSGEIVAVYDDITEQKLAEEALQRAEKKARNILESISDAFFAMDDHLVVTYFNAEAERLLNRRAGDVLGCYLFDSFPEIKGSVFDENFRQAVREKAPLAFEVKFEVEPYRNWYDVRIYPQDVGISVYFQVVTKQKRAEEELRQLNLELESRVRERTAQLEMANKELESFSYSVSHDLRAPLRHLTGFVNLLSERNPETLDTKSRHYLEVISSAAVQMGKLIDDILSFSRMGRAEMMSTDVDMARLVEEVRSEMQPDMQDREVVWSIGLLSDVRGDRAMLKIVFANLMGNAVKFTRDRTPARIEVGHQEEAEENVFFVRDNGAGFNIQYADKLFRLFQRLHPEDEFEGNGVGLANVRRIISRHGGRTWAEGEVGKGATFYFSLPKHNYSRTTGTMRN